MPWPKPYRGISPGRRVGPAPRSGKRLKNGDFRRATALRQVAQRLDCEILLSLADVHETWACEEEDGRGYRGHWESEEEDDEDDEVDTDDASDMNLVELIDESVELRNGIDSEGRKVVGAGSMEYGELIYTTPSSHFKHHRSTRS